MNKTWKFALAGLLLVGVASAQMQVGEPNSFHGILQGQPVVGINRTDSTARILTVSSGGVLSTAESAPAMDANLTFQLINNAGLPLGGADSSGIMDTHRMRLGMLLIKPFVGTTNTSSTDTTLLIRIAVQVRTHLNNAADSSSTFAIYPYGMAPLMNALAGAVVPDSSVQGQIAQGLPLPNLLATPSATTAWSGEFIVVIDAKRWAHANAVGVNGHTFYYPNGIAIPLSSLFGRDIYSPYTSVRVRYMTAMMGTTPKLAVQLGLTVTLVGTPL